MSMIGLCVRCKKDGIIKEIECEVIDGMGRTVLRRYCGNHSQGKKK